MSNTNDMSDSGRLSRLSSLALRTLNTMHANAEYAGQCATDATRWELVNAHLATISFGGNLADPSATCLTLTTAGKRIASKALDVIRAR